MPRRKGMSLVEVLVAIFIMGIGMVALLTLFPVGVLRMAQAIRDERAAQSAINAHALSILQNVRIDGKVASESLSIYQPTIPITLPVKDFYKNPMPGTLIDAEDYGPSYPVFVDAAGYQAAGNLLSRDWVSGNAGYLCRRTTNYTYNATQAIHLQNIARWFALQDDINFYNQDPPPLGTQLPGTPKAAGGVTGTYTRDTRFSWSYLLRRPNTIDTSVVDCTIIIYENRPLLALSETLYTSSQSGPTATTPVPTNPVVFDLSANTITVTYDATTTIAPNIKPGNWIYDATIVPTSKDVQSCFYRVVGVDVLATNQVRFEVQQPLRDLRSSPKANYYGSIIVMENILEVFEKGPGRLP